MNNTFTKHLEQEGWHEADLMTYRKTGIEYEIFFDNSNAIEIYLNKKRVKDAYLSQLDDLANLLKSLKL